MERAGTSELSRCRKSGSEITFNSLCLPPRAIASAAPARSRADADRPACRAARGPRHERQGAITDSVLAALPARYPSAATNSTDTA